MKLFYTPRSHYSRKIRLVLDGLGKEVELLDVGNVANLEAYGSNPLMKVPALVDGDFTLFDSDLIAQYVVRQFNPEDRFEVCTQDFEVLNLRAVINGIMASEVEIILARRTGTDTDTIPRFKKHEETVAQGLVWLEQHADRFSAAANYLNFHLVALWDHLVVTKIVPLTAYPKIANISAQLDAIPVIGKSSPKLL